MLVRPQAAHASSASANIRTFSANVKSGMTRSTHATAFSVKTPLGFPSESVSIVPPSGGIVPASIPISSRTFVFVAQICPQTRSRTIGISVDILSRSKRVGSRLSPLNRSWFQPMLRTPRAAASGWEAMNARQVSTICPMLVHPERSACAFAAAMQDRCM